MRTRAAAILLWGILSALGAAAESRIAFKHHYIDRGGPAGEAWAVTLIADIDNDRHPDTIVGKSEWGQGAAPACFGSMRGGIGVCMRSRHGRRSQCSVGVLSKLLRQSGSHRRRLRDRSVPVHRMRRGVRHRVAPQRFALLAMLD